MSSADADQPDRCPRCLCSDCNGRLDQHADGTCGCEDCVAYPEYACTAFVPPVRISILAQQLGPLLSAHLNEKARRRCLAVAHTAHHALHDYDHPEESR